MGAHGFRRRFGRHGSVVFLVPEIPDDAAPALKDALALRNVAILTGRCECGAAPIIDVRFPGRFEVFMLHADDCPANIDRLQEGA